MNSLHKQAYAVTPFKNESSKFEQAGLIPIITDGTHFLRQIKAHAVNKKIMLNDNIYEAANGLYESVRKAHSHIHLKVRMKDYPELIYAASYQDGMMHALGRAINMRGTGEYSDPARTHRVIHAYLRARKQKLTVGNYEDVAYIDGYKNALSFMMLDHKERKNLQPPLYYMFGPNGSIWTFSEFVRRLKRSGGDIGHRQRELGVS